MNAYPIRTSGWSTPAITFYPYNGTAKRSLVFSFLIWEFVIEWGPGI